MRASIAAFLLSWGAISAAINLRHTARQASQSCCFNLDSAGAMNDDVEEDHSGHLRLAGSFPQGVFCLEGGKVQDGTGNQCFIKNSNHRFQCYQKGVVGNTTFHIVSTSNGTTKLVYDNGLVTYLACPSTLDDGYEIFSTSKPDKTGCLEVSLVLSDQTGTCAVNSSSSNSTAHHSCSSEVKTRKADPIPLA